ncbi:hypothetical protein RJ640_028196 [Escallonia rubra]|uniref:ClpA/ClpB AAA lid domain-containing protein n=1 Tax=Escallonia rubra TaxID=112253 RepID=A0AA88U1S4_9ASTE|nr:hypothetical protein RJ640_028196 [Escallonia rubra]
MLTISAKRLRSIKSSRSCIHMIGEREETVGAVLGSEITGTKMPTLDEYGSNLTNLAKEKALAQMIADNNVPETISGKTHRNAELWSVGACIYVQCIGTTTQDEYRMHVEKDPALERPSVDETIEIFGGLSETYETHHKVHYTKEALIAAAQLSNQYISLADVIISGDRFLPDKAIDLLPDKGAKYSYFSLSSLLKMSHKQLFFQAAELRDQELKLRTQFSTQIDKWKEKNKAEIKAGKGIPLVTEDDLQQVVSSWTRMDESSRLPQMEETLHKRVIGQDEAVKAINCALRRA